VCHEGRDRWQRYCGALAERRSLTAARVDFPSLVELPIRRIVVERPELADLIVAARPITPVEIVRAEDFVHLTFSFSNLRFDGAQKGVPVLKRAVARRPAFLIVDCHEQHVTEKALFERAPSLAVKDPPPPAPADPDKPPVASEGLPGTPIFASIAGATRLAFKVTNQAILYSVAGLLEAMRTLDLSVAPHATPPSFARLPHFSEILLSEAVNLTQLFARGPSVGVARGRRVVDSPDSATRAAAELIALGRMRATAAVLEHRFGTDAAVASAAATRLGAKVDLERAIGKIDVALPVEELPPPPAPASPTETSIELPWRLQLSPNRHGAFAHSLVPIEHEGRYELWHSRLGVRATGRDGKPILDKDGKPTVDERSMRLRTIRAIWARDFDVFPSVGKPQFGFTPDAAASSFPPANRDEDVPKVRMSLNSRDRMMLVHETSNFHLTRQRRRWTPPAVPTNRLMVTGLGGWLDSRAAFPTLPDGVLTIEEWKHRAALGRDHEVRVVYAGFLLPFGHRASLIKVTERKLSDVEGADPTYYLFQRMFIVVREPEKTFRNDSRPVDGRRLDLTMPFASVRILTRVTPQLDEPHQLVDTVSGYVFEPEVLNAPFQFKLLAVDLENNPVDLSGPLVFMERDGNLPGAIEDVVKVYNGRPRALIAHGQKIAYAESEQPDDTILATDSLSFDAVTASFLQTVPQDEPRFKPVLFEAKAVVPAMSALAGASAPTSLQYPQQYAANGFGGNAAQVFLKAVDKPELNFAGQGDRSGGLVTPSIEVKALSRLTGPIGGDYVAAMTSPSNFNVGDFFANIPAKLFGLIPLSELFNALGFTPDRVPKFVTQTLDVASTLKQNVERIRNAAQAHAAELGAAATTLKTDVDALIADLALLANDPTNPPNLTSDLNEIAGDLDPFIQAVVNAPALPQTEKQQLETLARRIQDQLENAAAVTAAVNALVAFAKGLKLPEVVTARLDWSTGLDPWPQDDPIFAPIDPQARITLAVEIQAPTKPGKKPSAFVACSLSPFDLRLIGSTTFIVLHFEVIEFSIAAGKKPDVNVKLRENDGIEFVGPLEFVDTLRQLIPFDGFSDPPYLDVTAEGVKSGFDFPIPDVAIGVFALTNISLGAHLKVPFIDESIETAFNFSTRENPFRLQVSLFAGGGFFGITITPDRVRVLEAALEFGAAISVNLGVASGSVSIMAGIYFRMETDEAGDERAQLAGYFRMRGEVDVLGLISACIELYLELSYETATGKAVGRATITVEVEVAFFSTSVSISCEKKFAGSNGDPTFVEVMGLPSPAPPGAVRPWDRYARAFAED
jgi:hypothetical protein